MILNNSELHLFKKINDARLDVRNSQADVGRLYTNTGVGVV